MISQVAHSSRWSAGRPLRATLGPLCNALHVVARRVLSREWRRCDLLDDLPECGEHALRKPLANDRRLDGAVVSHGISKLVASLGMKLGRHPSEIELVANGALDLLHREGCHFSRLNPRHPRGDHGVSLGGSLPTNQLDDLTLGQIGGLIEVAAL